MKKNQDQEDHQITMTMTLMKTAHPQLVNIPLVTTMFLKTLVVLTWLHLTQMRLKLKHAKLSQMKLLLVSLPPYVLR